MSDYYSQLIDMINRISEYVAHDSEEVRKGLDDIMGGKVLVTRTDRIIARSEARGNMESYVSLVNDGDIKKNLQRSWFFNQLLCFFLELLS